MRAPILMLAFMVLAGCAGPVTRQVPVDNAALQREIEKQTEIALQARADHFRRFYHVVFRTFDGASAMCPKTRQAIGIYPVNQYDFNQRFRKAAARLWQTGDRVQILFVARGSPADRAGVKPLDVILRIDDTAAPQGKKAVSRLRKLLMQRLDKSGIVRLVLERRNPQGVRQTITTVVRPTRICDYRFGVMTNDRVNAFANGVFVVVTSGMMRFVNNDDELALVVSHELAHNIMGHIQKMRRNAWLGTLLDLLAAGYGVNTQGAFGRLALLRFSKAFEAEADYVGMYIMARAGWRIERAPNFWRRMAASHPGSNRTGFTRTHPITSRRFLALEKTVAEIRAKQASGQPLQPERKKPVSNQRDDDDEDE